MPRRPSSLSLSRAATNSCRNRCCQMIESDIAFVERLPTLRRLRPNPLPILGTAAASALLKIDVDLALLARKTKQAPLAGARRAVLEKTRTFPVRDAKLAPQVLEAAHEQGEIGRQRSTRHHGDRASGDLSKLLLHPRMRAMLPWRPATTAADAPRPHLAADAAAACPQILTK
jgi:hypothetical protein